MQIKSIKYVLFSEIAPGVIIKEWSVDPGGSHLMLGGSHLMLINPRLAVGEILHSKEHMQILKNTDALSLHYAELCDKAIKDLRALPHDVFVALKG